jgi:hypothetical protein
LDRTGAALLELPPSLRHPATRVPPQTVIGHRQDGRPIYAVAGAAMYYRQPLSPQWTAAGTAVTAATLTSGGGGQPLPQLMPGEFNIGARITLEAFLEITNGSTANTLTLGFYVGSQGQAISSKASSGTLAATAAIAMPTSVTAVPAILRWSGRIEAMGPSAGKIYGQGEYYGPSSLTAFAATVPFPTTAALRTVTTLNFDQINEFDIGITLSATTGAPSVTVTDFVGELSG